MEVLLVWDGRVGGRERAGEGYMAPDGKEEARDELLRVGSHAPQTLLNPDVIREPCETIMRRVRIR